MSEYQERHAVSRLIGSPPGYVGYEEGGLLTEAVRKNPHAVLLLDEIEKAHQDIYNILLQVMDYATLTDNAGRKADFRNVILIMTSNAGARDIGKPLIGFGNRILDETVVSDAVNRAFSPEFRNRLNRVVRFSHLGNDILRMVVKKEIAEFIGQLEEQKVALEVDEEIYDYLANKTNSQEYGAREIERLVDDEIRSLFIDALLYGSLQNGGKAHLRLQNDVPVLV
jgi:ATP-dependent Clp protease ATP-binding subunit ClpA